MSNTLPIFKQYPALEKNLPYVRLGTFPTPVEELKGLSDDCKVFIKRDDLSGEEYGGNKVRKLEFALGEALQQGCEEVLTFGCDGSNHALAVGIYAKKLGMQSNSILRTQHRAMYVRNNLLKSLYYGINLYHCENLDEMNAVADKLQKENVAKNKKPIYPIPIGGSSPLGTVGFVNAAFELKEQVAAGLIPEPDFIYATAGTLGTVAGLTVGLDMVGLKTKVISVKVNGENRINVPAFVDLMNDTAKVMMNADPGLKIRTYSADDVHIEQNYYGEDYAMFTEEGCAAVRTFKDKFGIQLDGTYTGKTCAAMLDAIKEEANKGKTFLFWNTLNSKDPHNAASQVDYHDLPKDFWPYFEEEVQPLDK